MLENLQSILSCSEKLIGERTLERVVNLVREKPRTGGEMRLTPQIRDYEMEQIILDVVSDVNVLTK